jgi:tRNA threonylcarbamoyladenosine modification (KEOPS) complex Cgi121 subunit
MHRTSVLPSLTELDISGCYGLTVSHALHLERCATLRQLTIADRDCKYVSERTVAALARIPALTALSVRVLVHASRCAGGIARNDGEALR